MSETELKAKTQEAGGDMQRLLGWLKGQYEAGFELPQMKLLARVFAESFQVEPGADGSVLTLQTQPPGAVKNPHEPDAQWGCKGKQTAWVGYKVQVAETVSDTPLLPGEPTRSFITAMATQLATGSDEAGLQQVRQEQQDSGLGLPPELFVDSAYVSGEVLAQEALAGRELIGPAQEPTNKGTGFKSDAFDVNLSQRLALCPAGRSSSNCSRLREGATGKVSYRFEWGRQCQDCPLKNQCVGKNQEHRTLTVGEHHEHLQQRRREQKTEAFKQRMRQRNAIEGTQSELVRGQGLRQARYRRLPKVRLQNYLIGAGCNAKRWLSRIRWKIRCGLMAASGARANAVTG